MRCLLKGNGVPFGMVLYSYFRSSASYRVRCALHLKAIEFEYVPIHLVKEGGEQFKPEYKMLNSMSQVPTIVDGDFVLAESMAIIQYIDSKWKEPPLFPKSPKQWAPILQVCEVINSGMQPYQNAIVMSRLEKQYGFDEGKRTEWVRFFMSRGLESLEKILSKTSGKYCFGNEVTAADCFLVPQIFSADRFKVDVGPYKTLQKVYENCEKLSAFQNAHPSKQVDFQ